MKTTGKCPKCGSTDLIGPVESETAGQGLVVWLGACRT